MAADSPRIFISYRRADSAANVGRLFDWLTRQFGSKHVRFDDVFVDTDGIHPGDDFVDVLQKRLASADVVLVVIGPHWRDIADEMGPRLEQPDDPVRQEVAGALATEKLVIPVLVGGTRMPSAAELPAPLQRLTRCQAIEIDDALNRFPDDFDRLVNAILQRTRSWVETEADRLRVFVKALKLSSLAVPVVAVLVVLALAAGLLNRFDIDVYASSYLQTAADRLLPAARAPGVAIVAIDGENLQRLEQRKPRQPDLIAAWYEERAAWREDAATLVDRVVKSGARAILFDVYFEEQTTADEALAAAIRRAQMADVRVVVGAKRLDDDGRPDIAPALREIAEWGSVCVRHRFGHNPMIALAVLDPTTRTEEIRTGSLPALALRAITADPQPRFGIESRSILLTDFGNHVPRFSMVGLTKLRPTNNRDSDCLIPPSGSDTAMLLIRQSETNYWSGDRLESMTRLLDNDAQVPGIRGNIVLVGGFGAAGDLHPLADGFAQRDVNGVELHANAIVDLLHGRELKRPTLGTNLIALLLMGTVGATFGYVGATWSVSRRRVTLAVTFIGYLLLAVALAVGGWLLPILYYIVAFVILYLMLRRLRLASFAPVNGYPERRSDD